MRTMTEISGVQRGHETAEHRTSKLEIIASLRGCGYDPVICEHEYCDIVAVRTVNSARQTLAVEMERSPRNVLRNIERNFAHGCDVVLIVCPDVRILTEVTRKIAHHAPHHEHIAFATPLTLQVLQSHTVSERNPSEKRENPS
jgi:hypothetical protein